MSNGLFCLSFVSKFIASKKISSDEIYNQICYLINNFGIKNIAVGTDFYGTKDLPLDIKEYNDFDILKKLLIKNKVKNKTINKIFYSNFLNFYNKIKN